jgi:predicted nucleotidyltransferase
MAASEERMPAKLKNDPVLTRFRTAVGEAYGDRLERVVLFGSRARGDHRPDSDYDIAVFIKDPGTLWDEAGRLAELEDEILHDSAMVINAMPFPAGVHRERTAFMPELREDGLDL